MGGAAVAAARAVGYVGAGTVEFIVDAVGDVLLHGDEHAAAGRAPGDRDDHRPRPGRVAAAGGLAARALPVGQDELAIRGHAIEARVYAENPDKGFLPAIGRLAHLRTPAGASVSSGATLDDNGLARWPSRRRCASTAACGEGDAISAALRPDDRQADRLGRGPRAGPRADARGAARLRGRRPGHQRRLPRAADGLPRPSSRPTWTPALIERERERCSPPDARAGHGHAGRRCRRACWPTRPRPADRPPGPGPVDQRDGWRLNGTLQAHADASASAAACTRCPSNTARRRAPPCGAGTEATCLSSAARDGSRLRRLLGARQLAARPCSSGETLHLFAAGRPLAARLCAAPGARRRSTPTRPAG